MSPARPLLAVLLLGLMAACPSAERSGPPPSAPAETEPADTFLERGPQVTARHWTVALRVDSPGIGSFARLSSAQRRALDDLIQASVVELDVLAVGGRLLLALPVSFPGGPFELLLAEDARRVVVFQPTRRTRARVPRTRLPDVLDGHEASLRADFEVTLEQTRPAGTSAPSAARRRTRGVRAEVGLSYVPVPERPRSWPLQLALSLDVPDEPRPFFSAHQEPLLHVALPLLQNERGRRVLESLMVASGAPLGWSLSVLNEGNPSGVAPLFRAAVHDRGHVRVDAARLSTARTGYRDARNWGAGSGPGRQLIPAPALAALRSSTPRGRLTVTNRSAFSALVYIDGALMGWVAARQTQAFNGLPEGYYRVYALSASGVRAWGPTDLYVPGPLVLR